MTRIGQLALPPSLAGTSVSRWAIGPVGLIEWGGFDYSQTATRKSTEGVPEGISLAVRPSGRWSLTQAEVTRGSAAGDLLAVVDVTQTMRVEASADTRFWQMFFSADQLGLTVETIRTATTLIGHSPLQRLVASHVLNMPIQDLDRLALEALRDVGQATTELVRAMLIGAARPEAHTGTEVSAIHLRHAIKQYARLHLRDPQLNPQDIARAHRISVRYLYNLWRDEETTLARWIGQQRLEAARQDLADPRLARKTIAAIGREWGFPSAAHFTRRFRDTYAISPREWRDAAFTGDASRPAWPDSGRSLRWRRGPA